MLSHFPSFYGSPSQNLCFHFKPSSLEFVEAIPVDYCPMVSSTLQRVIREGFVYPDEILQKIRDLREHNAADSTIVAKPAAATATATATATEVYLDDDDAEEEEYAIITTVPSLRDSNGLSLSLGDSE